MIIAHRCSAWVHCMPINLMRVPFPEQAYLTACLTDLCTGSAECSSRGRRLCRGKSTHTAHMFNFSGPMNTWYFLKPSPVGSTLIFGNLHVECKV